MATALRLQPASNSIKGVLHPLASLENPMLLKSLRGLLVDQLQEVYLAEVLIEEALARLEIAATHPSLKAAFHEHDAQTKVQMQRLESVFEHLSQSPRGGRALSMKALLQEGEDRVSSGGDSAVLDAGLIASAQQVEHWEIAAYGTAHAYAVLLGEGAVADLLAQTLAEEKETDRHLTELAKSVNALANATA